jgi:hypothetical protein
MADKPLSPEEVAFAAQAHEYDRTHRERGPEGGDIQVGDIFFPGGTTLEKIAARLAAKAWERDTLWKPNSLQSFKTLPRTRSRSAPTAGLHD